MATLTPDQRKKYYKRCPQCGQLKRPESFWSRNKNKEKIHYEICGTCRLILNRQKVDQDLNNLMVALKTYGNVLMNKKRFNKLTIDYFHNWFKDNSRELKRAGYIDKFDCEEYANCYIIKLVHK